MKMSEGRHDLSLVYMSVHNILQLFEVDRFDLSSARTLRVSRHTDSVVYIKMRQCTLSYPYGVSSHIASSTASNGRVGVMHGLGIFGRYDISLSIISCWNFTTLIDGTC